MHWAGGSARTATTTPHDDLTLHRGHEFGYTDNQGTTRAQGLCVHWAVRLYTQRGTRTTLRPAPLLHPGIFWWQVHRITCSHHWQPTRESSVSTLYACLSHRRVARQLGAPRGKWRREPPLGLHLSESLPRLNMRFRRSTSSTLPTEGSAGFAGFSDGGSSTADEPPPLGAGGRSGLPRPSLSFGLASPGGESPPSPSPFLSPMRLRSEAITSSSLKTDLSTCDARRGPGEANAREGWKDIGGCIARNVLT
eukprot:scaffold4985_cov116-Isochrysis_galbana.AAC.8